MEIERKFILRKFPSEIRRQEKGILRIEQYYCSGYRVRKAGKQFFITVKKGRGLVRNEWEEEIPKWVFDALRKNSLYPAIKKLRHRLQYARHILEVDVYLLNLCPLIVMECEFKTKDDAKKFHLPEWACDAVEVTGGSEFMNRSLAKNGLPKELKNFYRNK